MKDDLLNYCANSNDWKYGYSKLPDQKFRLRDEEIAGSKELEEEKTEEIIQDNGEDNGNHAVGEMNIETAHKPKEEVLKTLKEDDTDNEPDEFADVGKGAMSIHGDKDISLDDFEIKYVLGKGTFGKVFLTQLKKNGKLYAIKSIWKDVLLETDQIESTKLERDILLECQSPFLCGMDYVFQNELRLYFVMPFIRGGELYKYFLK